MIKYTVQSYQYLSFSARLSVISGFKSVMKWVCHANLSYQYLKPTLLMLVGWCCPSKCLPGPLHSRNVYEISIVLTYRAISDSDSTRYFELKLCFFLEGARLAPQLVTGVQQ